MELKIISVIAALGALFACIMAYRAISKSYNAAKRTADFYREKYPELWHKWRSKQNKRQFLNK